MLLTRKRNVRGCFIALAEAVAAGTAPLRVRVIDRESLLLDRVFEVDARTLKVGNAHLVNDDLDPIEVGNDVVFQVALIKKQLVDESRATARLHCDPEAKVFTAFLAEQSTHLVSGGIRQRDSVGHFLICDVRHVDSRNSHPVVLK